MSNEIKRASGNMYTWVSHLWSPAIGCEHQCSYCYAKQSGYQPDQVRRQSGDFPYLGEGRKIFVCHMCDLFSEHTSTDLIDEILKHCQAFRHNTYVFQSKNPKRFLEFQGKFPPQYVLGTTIETDRQDLIDHQSKAPSVLSRAYQIADAVAPMKFLTIEPIMDFDLEGLMQLVEIARPNFINIGADSKRHYLPEPSRAKVNALIEAIGRLQIPVIEKSNLERLK